LPSGPFPYKIKRILLTYLLIRVKVKFACESRRIGYLKWFQNLQSRSTSRRGEVVNRRDAPIVLRIGRLAPTPDVGARGGFETTFTNPGSHLDRPLEQQIPAGGASFFMIEEYAEFIVDWIDWG
jgi:hypothetical protein